MQQARQREVEQQAISIDAQGHWVCDGATLSGKVAAQFDRALHVNDGGHYELALGQQRQSIEVEDTAYSVRNAHLHVRRNVLEGIDLELSDGEVERLDPTTLMQRDNCVLYCRIRRNGFLVPCRFSEALYTLLAQYIEERKGRFVLPMKQGDFVLHSYRDRPSPMH